MTLPSLPRKILIIDDDDDYQRLLCTHLGKLLPEATVVEYSPHKQGIPDNTFDWRQFDVLILDYDLQDPKFTGLDLLSRNRHKSGFPATVMLSSMSSAQLASRAVNFGIHRCLDKKDLSKNQLKEAIVDSWKEYVDWLQKRQQTTQHNLSFSKELFYLKLAQPLGPEGTGPKRILMMIMLDNINVLQEFSGLLGFDGVLRHVAKQAFSFYKEQTRFPNITLAGDNQIALQINAPEADMPLPQEINKLLAYLRQSPASFMDKEFSYTVSIGLLKLTEKNYSIEQVLHNVFLACLVASTKQDTDSFHLWSSADESRYDIASKKIDLHPVSMSDPEVSFVDTMWEEELGVTTPAPPPKNDKIAFPPAMRTASSPPATTATPAVKSAPAETRSAAVPTTANPGLDLSLTPIIDSGADTLAGNLSAMTGADFNYDVILRDAIERQMASLAYQPIMGVSLPQRKDSRQLFSTLLRLTRADHQVVDIFSLNEYISDLELEKDIVRWMVRQLIGTIYETIDNGGYMFELTLSRAWFVDNDLFAWLQSLLAKVHASFTGGSILLNIRADVLQEFGAKVMGMANILRKKYHCKITLRGVAINNLPKILKIMSVDYLSLSNASILTLAATAVIGKDPGVSNQIELLKHMGRKIIANDIADAGMLESAINAGADLVMGDFVGKPQNTIGEIINEESFALI